MKIDVFCHLIPEKYEQALLSKVPDAFGKHYKGLVGTPIDAAPALRDLDIRFRIMDKYGDYVQVLSTGSPAIETVLRPKDAIEVARIVNDEMAELVMKHPDRFVAAVACLPMNDVDAALDEVDRAISKLGFRGIQIYTSINGKPLDSPEFMPLYEKMVDYNLPILIHPMREITVPDYPTEKESKYMAMSILGWPYETTLAMHRLVFGGVLEKYPKLKVITHHAGGILPLLTGRISHACDLYEMRLGLRYSQDLPSKPLLDYYRMFYVDTAVHSTPALACSHAFFGTDHMLFATDTPYDNELGNRKIRETINSIEELDINNLEKKKIFEDNARNLLRLPI